MTATVFTCQSTGLVRSDKPLTDPSQPRIVSLSAAMISPTGDVRARFDFLADGGNIASAAAARSVHGITEREMEIYGLERKMLLAALTRMLNKSTALLAFNYPFFASLIDIELAAHDADTTNWKRGGLKRICLMERAAQKLRGKSAMKLSDAVAGLTGNPYDPPHNYRKSAYDLDAYVAMWRALTCLE